jgi:hypothetical protein
MASMGITTTSNNTEHQLSKAGMVTGRMIAAR